MGLVPCKTFSLETHITNRVGITEVSSFVIVSCPEGFAMSKLMFSISWANLTRPTQSIICLHDGPLCKFPVLLASSCCVYVDFFLHLRLLILQSSDSDYVIICLHILLNMLQ